MGRDRFWEQVNARTSEITIAKGKRLVQTRRSWILSGWKAIGKKIKFTVFYMNKNRPIDAKQTVTVFKFYCLSQA